MVSFGLVLCHINHYRLFNTNLFLYTKTVLFQIIQFSISTYLSNIWPLDRIPSGATTPGQSGLGNHSNKIVLRITQSSSITGDSPSDCLESYTWSVIGGGDYPSVEMQLMYSAAPAGSADNQWETCWNIWVANTKECFFQCFIHCSYLTR